MSAAGDRVCQLWLEATAETIEAAIEEAGRLAPQLEEQERDYLEGLAVVLMTVRRMKADGCGNGTPGSRGACVQVGARRLV